MTGGLELTISYKFNIIYRLCDFMKLLNCSSVFDVDDHTVPEQFRNGFTFVTPDEQVSLISISQIYHLINTGFVQFNVINKHNLST